jgi:phage/plasmid-associated DNA primase
MPTDDVVALVLAATRAAAGEYGACWNWAREERTIRRDCKKWLEKHPPPKPVAAPRDENGGSPSSLATVAPANSEEYLSLIFADRHEADLRFVAKWGQWFRWDNTRWLLEETLHAFDMSRLICREAANACNKAGVAKALASAKTVAAVERLAKADRKLAATFEQWDTDANKLNTAEED